MVARHGKLRLRRVSSLDALSSLVSRPRHRPRPRRHRLCLCCPPAHLRRVLSRVKSLQDGYCISLLQGEHSFPWRVRPLSPHAWPPPPDHQPCALPSDTSFKLNMDSQPAPKKRKISPTGPSNSQPSQSSFADVLQRLKDDAGESRGPSSLTFLRPHPYKCSYRRRGWC